MDKLKAVLTRREDPESANITEEDRGFVQDTGTTHTVLLPPPIAYGNSEGHELENTWLRFEVKIDRMII